MVDPKRLKYLAKAWARPFAGRLVLMSLVGWLPAGCAPKAACDPGLGRPMSLVTLYFGQSIRGGGEVGETAWRRFLATTVTPAFPDGLTVTDGNGQWLDPQTQRITTERTKIVTIAASSGPDLDTRLARVRRAYDLDFHQESVGLTVVPSCGDF